MTASDTQLESQLRSLQRPTRPLDAGDFGEVRALGGTRDHRRVVWRLAAASVVVIALIGGVFAVGRRTAPVDTLSPGGTTRTYTLVPDGVPAIPAQLDQTVPIVQRRLDSLGIDGATVVRHGESIEITVRDSLEPRDLKLVTMSSRVELRGVLESGVGTGSNSSSPGGTALPPAPMTTLAPEMSGTLQGPSETYQVGPAALTGGIESARASINSMNGQWIVNPVFVAGPSGIDALNEIAGRCFRKEVATCATGRLAIIVDDVVVSAPSINAARFDRDQIQISGSFDEQTAKDLAEQMGSGSLPVPLRVS